MRLRRKGKSLTETLDRWQTFGGLVGLRVIGRRVNQSSHHGSRKNHVPGQSCHLLHQWLSSHERHHRSFFLEFDQYFLCSVVSDSIWILQNARLLRLFPPIWKSPLGVQRIGLRFPEVQTNIRLHGLARVIGSKNLENLNREHHFLVLQHLNYGQMSFWS